MFFDKFYRRDRFDTITKKIDHYQNVNEFRTLVMQSFHTFPLAATRNIYFIYNPNANKDTGATELASTGEYKRDDNILLEKAYMSTFWQAFRVEVGVQMALAGTLFYTAVGFATRTFSNSTFRVFLMCGLTTHCYSMYLRRITMNDYQRQIEPLYGKQVKAYERFFYDEGFDE